MEKAGMRKRTASLVLVLALCCGWFAALAMALPVCARAAPVTFNVGDETALKAAITNTPQDSSSVILLDNDISLTSAVVLDGGKSVTIRPASGAKTITAAATFSNESMFLVQGGSLVFEDIHFDAMSEECRIFFIDGGDGSNITSLSVSGNADAQAIISGGETLPADADIPGDGGGAILMQGAGAVVRLTNVDITDCIAGGPGGAIASRAGASQCQLYLRNSSITNCTISIAGTQGSGAIYIAGTTLYLSGLCTITGNTFDSTGDVPGYTEGSIHMGSGAYIEADPVLGGPISGSIVDVHDLTMSSSTLSRIVSMDTSLEMLPGLRFYPKEQQGMFIPYAGEVIFARMRLDPSDSVLNLDEEEWSEPLRLTTPTEDFTADVSENIDRLTVTVANLVMSPSDYLLIPQPVSGAPNRCTYDLRIKPKLLNPGFYRLKVSFRIAGTSYEACGQILLTANPPTLTTTPTGLSFGSVHIGTASPAQIIAVAGTRLGADIVVNAPTNAAFTITQDAGWNARTGGTLNVTFTPTEERAYSATLTISSAGTSDVVIPLSGTGKLVPKADPTKNFITPPSGTITAGTPFSFTATGHRQNEVGADENETRYVPTIASATSTVNFTESSGTYTANMTIDEPGDYTLTATFQQQTWNQSDGWKDVDSVDTKSITLNVHEAANPPSLTKGRAVRISKARATVSFQSNDAGQYHYLVQKLEDTAPSASTVQASPSTGTMQSGTNSFALPSLANGAAKAVYIMGKNTAGSWSNLLKVIVPPDHTATQSPGTIGQGENAVFVFNGEYVHFSGATLIHEDGKVYPFDLEKNGGITTLSHGGTIAGDAVPSSVKITLYAAWLDTLPAGTYTLKVDFDDGTVQSSGSADFTLTREATPAPDPGLGSPQTGDNSNAPLWVLCGGVALLGLVLLIRRRVAQR